MKRSELLLVKPTMVETVLGELLARPQGAAAKWTEEGQGQQAGVFSEFIKQFEALTAMTIKNGTAIIPLRGMVTPDDPFAVFYGETNLTSFLGNFNEALKSEEVKKIVLNIYSPGGYVYGVEAAANAIYQARGKKPIVAYTDSLAASAAYWIASAADKIVLGSETAEVGSIGVYLAHFDYSEMLKAEGIKVTEITSGEFKGIGSPYSAMSDEEKKELQKDSHYVYTRFVNTVARNRGMEVKDVLKSANGLMFYGSEAVKVGLADSIATLQETATMATPENTQAPVVASVTTNDVALAAEKARADAAEKQLKEFQDKAALDAANAAATECKALVKSTLGREATEKEVSAYQKMDADGREMFAAGLKESRANRDGIIKKAGLTEEQVTAGANEEHNPANNLLLQAASKLGFTVVASK